MHTKNLSDINHPPEEKYFRGMVFYCADRAHHTKNVQSAQLEKANALSKRTLLPVFLEVNRAKRILL